MKLLTEGNYKFISNVAIASNLTIAAKRLNYQQELDELIKLKSEIDYKILSLKLKIDFAGNGCIYDLDTKTKLVDKL